MTVREELERLEHRRLNPLAAFADKSKGRLKPEPPREQDVRTCYQRDTDRIVHSKSFRRLMHKTQVFLRPEGDHYRTRMTHTLEVSRIARSITRALGLNEDLAEAIAVGHDLGHTPFGHAGEAALSDMLGKPVGSDSDNNKSTYVSLLGIDRCKELVAELTKDAVECLEVFPNDTNALCELAYSLSQRQN